MHFLYEYIPSTLRTKVRHTSCRQSYGREVLCRYVCMYVCLNFPPEYKYLSIHMLKIGSSKFLMMT
jgi:hypothetical protein